MPFRSFSSRLIRIRSTHGGRRFTTGEVPIERFLREEAHRPHPIDGIPPFVTARELVRKVQSDCAIEVDGNAYSVPWRLIGERVRVVITSDHLRISHAGGEVAVPSGGLAGSSGWSIPRTSPA